MKYRVQLNAVFNNIDANSILNEVESIKSDVFQSSPINNIEIISSTKKLKLDTDPFSSAETEYDSVNFIIGVTSHTGSPSGETEFEIRIDISFSIEQKYYDFLNYIETIKSNSINTDDYPRNCRFFICNHDEIPLVKDGEYSYIDFDGVQETHPII